MVAQDGVDLLRALCCLKDLVQPLWGHFQGFSPECVRLCCSRDCFADRRSPQISHSTGLTTHVRIRPGAW